jgi:hypothetical protein
LEGVFAGGDVTGDRATVVQAMAAGQRAAGAIDAYLAGGKLEAAPAPTGQSPLIINEAALPTSSRTPTPRLPVPQRTLRGEDSSTLSPDALAPEPLRCANCGCVAVNASDLATALVALDAQVKTTQRTLGIGDLFAAAESKSTVLAADELIEEIAIPAPPPGSRQRYLKFRIRNAIDFPIVGVEPGQGRNREGASQTGGSERRFLKSHSPVPGPPLKWCWRNKTAYSRWKAVLLRVPAPDPGQPAGEFLRTPSRTRCITRKCVSAGPAERSRSLREAVTHGRGFAQEPGLCPIG